MMNLEQCCRKIIYDDLVRHCMDAECFRHQSKAEYYFEEDRAYKNYFNRIIKDFNRDFNDIRKFLNGSNHLTRKFRKELELKKIDDDIFYNTTLKVMENYNKKTLDSSKYDEEQKFPKYDGIHLLDFKDSVIDE